MTASDYHGSPLHEGDHVTAWLDGTRYTATVKTIKTLMASDYDRHRIVLVRDDNDAERDSYADAVVVLNPETSTSKEQQ